MSKTENESNKNNTSPNDKYVSLKLGFVMAPGQKGSIINPFPGVETPGFGLCWGPVV